MSKTDNILEFFEGINRIPRKSGNREPICRYLTDWAHNQGFSLRRDGTDNLVIIVPGSAGYEKSPIVVLQGHSDMVCEKTPESDHDFSKDAIRCVIKGDWMRGDNTTLGADNGIALALAMDMATDPSVAHPPLEILITSDEEIGLIGANNLEEGFIEGKILLNLDSEDEGIFTIGCAGGADSNFSIPLKKERVRSGAAFVKLTIGGLLGGHSGMDITLNHGNALKMSGRILSDLCEKIELKLISLGGGSGATNAICRDSEAVFALASQDVAACRTLVTEWQKILMSEIKSSDPGLTVVLEEIKEGEGSCLTEPSCKALLRTLRLIPHGVEKVSSDIEDLVETSSNLAWMEIAENAAHFMTSQRSSVMTELQDMNLRMVDLAALAGGTCETINKYPSWQPNMESPLLQRCKEIYTDVMKKEPVVEAIHAGLECGLIGDMYPGMDMISIGPTIKHPHTPEERLYLPSLEPFRDFLVELLKSFKA